MPDRCVTEWRTEKEAVQLLKDSHLKWVESLSESRAADKSWEQVARTSVGANTYRGLHGLKEPPSIIFRPWALSFLKHGEFEKLVGLREPGKFDAEHDRTVKLLGKTLGERVNYGQAAKLLNLLMRSACESKAEFNHALVRIHVPLDQCVLKAIRRLTSTSKFHGDIGHIPSRPAMGWVETPQQYSAIQGFLRELSEKAEVPPIVVDYVAWTQAH